MEKNITLKTLIEIGESEMRPEHKWVTESLWDPSNNIFQTNLPN